jgi:heme oxygenase (biliverdin-IX-beta and delta-forming)
MTDDVLLRLRTATAEDHERVERALDLMDGSLDRGRLVRAMTLLHGFWRAADAGLDSWAAAHPADADRLLWPTRRRSDLYAGDLRALGSSPAEASPPLPPVPGTDEALGRMYVLEGSTLGGAFIDRHLARLPGLSGVRLHAFSPYGERTGAMWAAYRRATREHVASGGDPDRVVDAARDTFAALGDWVTGGSVVHCASGSSDLWTRR